MDKAQKGDSEPGHRQVQGRLDHQNPRAHRRARQSGPLRSAAGATLRYGRRRAFDRGRRIWRPARRPGLSHMSKEVEEELFTPRGELHFSCWRAFIWMGGQYIERDAADDRQILWRVVLSRSGVVFMKDDIERPVTIIFDAPVQSDGLQQLSRRQTLGQGDIMDHCRRLAAGLAPRALDASKRNETGKIRGLGRRDKLARRRSKRSWPLSLFS